MGWARGGRVSFRGGGIEAQLLCDGRVLRSGEGARWSCGLAQVRRLLDAGPLRVAHVVFAPARPRPLLLGLVRLRNAGSEPLVIDYSELWDVGTGPYRAGEGGAERDAALGTAVLADLASVVRARPPAEPPRSGLALDVRLAVPASTTRQLSFAYAAPGSGEPTPLLVRAWRGDVAGELERTARDWLARLGGVADPVAGYRAAVPPPNGARGG